MDDTLALQLTGDRMRALARGSGLALLGAGLLPSVAIDDQIVGLGQLSIDDPGFGSAWALVLAGVWLLAVSWSTEATLASGVRWVFFGLPWIAWASSVGRLGARTSAGAVVCGTSTALALAVVSAEPSRRAWRALTGAASLAVLAYVWPWPDAAPVLALGDALGRLWQIPSAAYLLRLLALLPFFGWPLLVVGLGAWRLRRPGREAPWTPATRQLVLGAPVLLLPEALRALEGGRAAGWMSLGEVLAASAPLLSLPSALRWQALSAEGPRPWGRWLAVTLAAGALALPAVAAARTWRPRVWGLAPATPAAEQLFGRTLPAWNDGRGQAATVVAEARAIDDALGAAMAGLVQAGADGDRSLRRWGRVVEAVNRVSQERRLPYYVDPTGLLVRRDEPGAPRFRLDTYRIEQAHRFEGDEGPRGALLLRRLTPHRTRLALLGLSRDAQPFALVVLDEIDRLADDLTRAAAQSPPRCAERPAQDALVEQALRECGEELAALAARSSVRDELLASIERHELQHQLDGPHLALAALVKRRLGLLWPGVQTEINRELSAHLVELTAGGQAPRLALIRLLRIVAFRNDPAESTTARLTLEALAPGASTPAQAFAALRALDDEALRRRGREAWREQYGKSLSTVRSLGLDGEPRPGDP